MKKMTAELESFLNTWDDCPSKKAFALFRRTLEGIDGVVLDFKVRPGITYSLRGAHPHHMGRDLFVLIDVIDDDPAARWLSVCFYDDMVTDSAGHGDRVPQGLMGEDARCFNVDEGDEDLVNYVVLRILEAGALAAKP